MRSSSNFIKYPLLHTLGGLRLDLRKGIFYDGDGQALVHAVQRSGGLPTTGNGWMGLWATWSRERCPSLCQRSCVKTSLIIPSDRTIWCFYVIATLNKHQDFTRINWGKGIVSCKLSGSTWTLVWSLTILSDMQTKDLGRIILKGDVEIKNKTEGPPFIFLRTLKQLQKCVFPSRCARYLVSLGSDKKNNSLDISQSLGITFIHGFYSKMLLRLP